MNKYHFVIKDPSNPLNIQVVIPALDMDIATRCLLALYPLCTYTCVLKTPYAPLVLEQHQRGFTILELLCVLGIVAGMIGMTLSFSSEVESLAIDQQNTIQLDLCAQAASLNLNVKGCNDEKSI